MSLRSAPLEEEVVLPDGRAVTVRIGLAGDSYIAPKDLETVTIELSGDGEHLAAVSTVLDPDQDSEARALLRDVIEGLSTGALEPTAGALEPLADTLR